MLLFSLSIYIYIFNFSLVTLLESFSVYSLLLIVFILFYFFHMNLYLFSSVESVLIEEPNCSSAISFVYAASSLIRS
jgi:hypothetical protein